MPYDVTQVQAHLKRYMDKIRDELTTEDDLRRYGTLVAKLQALNVQTEKHFGDQPIPFTAEDRAALRESYSEAVEAVAGLLSEEETGPVGLRLKLIGRELTPLLLADMQAIELTGQDPELGQRSLPELLSKVRTEAADLGDQPGPEGDAPMLLRVEKLDKVEIGVFRPTQPGVFGGQQTAYSRLAGLLGQPNLVTKAQPMLLLHKGGSSSGSFLPRAAGVDPAQIKAGDPLLSFAEQNLDTQAGVSGLASMQLLDFLFGAAGRGPEQCCLRFNPPYSTQAAPAKLVGLTVKADEAVFGDAPVDEAQLSALGVVPEALYNQLAVPGFEDQLRFALRDCDLPAAAVERILARREALIRKVEADRNAFADKDVGYLEAGRVRLVPENEFGGYHLKNLKAANPNGVFAKLLELPKTAEAQLQNRAVQPGAPLLAAPTAKLVGNGLRQEPDPLNLNRQETIRLRIPALDAKTIEKGGQNERYPVQWTENGRTRRGMFTLPRILSRRAGELRVLDSIANDPSNAEFRDVFQAIRDYYNDSEAGRGLLDLSSRLSDLPWRDMGLSEERYEQIKNDFSMETALRKLTGKLMVQYRAMDEGLREGHSRGERIELRNVAMSDIAEAMDVPRLLAKSTTAQVELDGRLVDGIFMEEAEGEDYKKAVVGTAMASITEDQAKVVFNTKGLKDLADLQILDYICLNQDRHQSNMFYRFSGLETGNPVFLGVQGIDNDFSFGTLIPPDDKQINLNLPKFNDIRVISESMAQTLRKPALAADIARKMQRNGLPQKEIEAAQKRLEKLQKKLNSGKLKVVRDEQWGTGSYTFEKLNKGKHDTSIFHTFKERMIDPLTRKAEYDHRQPGQYVPVKKPKYQTVQRVERFGARMLEADAAEKEERKARKRFALRSAEGLKTQVRVENPENRAIIALHLKIGALKTALEQGSLPWPWGSGEYRELCGACSELYKLTAKMTKQIRENPELEFSDDAYQSLQSSLGNLENCGSAYCSYKREDLEEYAAGRSTQARMNAATNCVKEARSLSKSYTQARNERKQPLHLVREKIRNLQGELVGLSGDALKKQTARILYLNGLTLTEKSKRSGLSVRKALQPQAMERQAGKFMSEPAFQRLADLPDDELRALAGGKGGQALGERFIKELVRQEQAAAAPKAPQAPDLQQAAPNANAEGPAPIR